MDLMEIRRGLMMGMANQNSFQVIIAHPDTQLTLADQVKTFLSQYIGSHKRAFVMLNYDFGAGLPSLNRQFCSAILYDGFTVSAWTRSNVSSLQTNNSVPGQDYWRAAYDLQISPSDSVTIIVDLNS